MASTIIIYQGDGNTTSFTIPFDYLKKTFVKVFLDTSTELKGGSSSDATADYYFKDATTIQLTKIVPTSTQTITIRRYTSATERVASFRDGSVLYAKDLDTSQVQAFHIAEEGRDILNDALTVDRNGNWDAKKKRITRVGDPVEATDAVNKKYVDSVVEIQKTAEEYAEASAASATLAQAWAVKTDGKVQDIDYSAKHYALDAKQTAAELQAKGLELEAQLTAHTDTQIARIDDKTDGKVQDTDYSAKHYALDAKQTAAELSSKELELEAQLTAHTDTQIARIDDKTDDTLVVNATGCAEKTWTLTADVAANTEITIPGSIYYVVGRHHLRVGYNGLTCYIGTNFMEVGNTDTKSNKFKLTFDAKSGDELDVWVAALGKADVVDAINTAQAANDAVAELSQKVVYKDAESAGS